MDTTWAITLLGIIVLKKNIEDHNIKISASLNIIAIMFISNIKIKVMYSPLTKLFLASSIKPMYFTSL